MDAATLAQLVAAGAAVGAVILAFIEKRLASFDRRLNECEAARAALTNENLVLMRKALGLS